MSKSLDYKAEIQIFSHDYCLACDSEITEGYPVIGGHICELCAKEDHAITIDMPDGSVFRTKSINWINFSTISIYHLDGTFFNLGKMKFKK
jgi:hypothetical protein